MPKETKEKELSFSDLLGVPFFVLLLAFFLFGIGQQDCFKVEGGTLKNNCENYSFTFPFGNNELFAAERRPGDAYICQAEDANNKQDNLVCIEGYYLDDKSSFDQNKLEQGVSNKANIISKRTLTYNDNLTYCFSIKSKEDTTQPIQNICFMEIKDKPKLMFSILGIAHKKEMPFENLEKLMNNYKNL